MTDFTTRRARELRGNLTDAERTLWRMLRERRLDNTRFRRQVPVGPYIADFAAFEPRLIVECDGGQHGGERDATRDQYLREQGFDVLRVWNNQVLQEPDAVWMAISLRVAKLREAAGASSRGSSRAATTEASMTPHPQPFPRKGGREQSEGRAQSRASVLDEASDIGGREQSEGRAHSRTPIADASSGTGGEEHSQSSVSPRSPLANEVPGPGETGQDHGRAIPPSPLAGEGLGMGGVGRSVAAGEPTRVAKAQPVLRTQASGNTDSSERELRIFGLNACLAVFAHRPHAIRKIYLLQSRVNALKPVLAWCAREKIGYRIVAADDLNKLTRSEHHEGVVFDTLRPVPLTLQQFLAAHSDRSQPALAIWLDGVGNPHNFGAVLRIAAHFGASVILPPGSTLALSAAACRVAEGAAEVVPLIAINDEHQALNALMQIDFEAVATVVRGGEDLYCRDLPKRSLLVFGAESAGVGLALLKAIPRQVRIPGTGAVESLNIATAVGVVAAEYWRAHARS